MENGGSTSSSSGLLSSSLQASMQEFKLFETQSVPYYFHLSPFDRLVNLYKNWYKMWKLRIGAEAGQDPYLFSTNNYLGRQIWEFDADAGSAEELAEVEEARRNFAANRSHYKASADLLWRMQFLREKKFEQNIPRVVIDDAEKIAYEDAEKALRRGILYMAALQADDGHWPAENSGCMFFIAPFVSYMFYYSHN
ncbi:hypothetical protein F2Q69_00016482 [Brassica cretica]|nr:hypothetical protein F2Q69_00016482 [Brassica cretica]